MKEGLLSDYCTDGKRNEWSSRINGEFSHDEITQDVLTSASFGISQEKAVAHE